MDFGQKGCLWDPMHKIKAQPPFTLEGLHLRPVGDPANHEAQRILRRGRLPGAHLLLHSHQQRMGSRPRRAGHHLPFLVQQKAHPHSRAALYSFQKSLKLLNGQGSHQAAVNPPPRVGQG
jgi:hypothetical protein